MYVFGPTSSSLLLIIYNLLSGTSFNRVVTKTQYLKSRRVLNVLGEGPSLTRSGAHLVFLCLSSVDRGESPDTTPGRRYIGRVYTLTRQCIKVSWVPEV